jgi:predicted nicotinamide N-methyase
MTASATVQNFEFGANLLQVFVPDLTIVKEQYQHLKKENPSVAFPYWSQVWPAALGLCRFLVKHTHYIQNKKVLELAAGLGLPSLVATRYACEVHASDHIPEAVELMKRSADLNGILNMKCSVLDWNCLPENTSTDILLLSDINYDPADFEIVFTVLQNFLDNGTTIILSTPQRLMAKPFIDRLLPFCIKREEMLVDNSQHTTAITLLILKLP